MMGHMCVFVVTEEPKGQDYNRRMHPVLRFFESVQKQHVTKYHYKDNLVVTYACLYMSIVTEANNNVVFTTTHTYNKVIYERDK